MHSKGLNLRCYSSGSGCLSFGWQNAEQNAAGREVTLTDIRRHLKTKNAKHLVKDGWVPVFVDGQWCIARKVRRLNENTLNIEATTLALLGENTGSFTYDLIDPAQGTAHWNLVFMFDLAGKTYELKNLSLLMVLRFFLYNEGVLTQQFNDPNAAKAARRAWKKIVLERKTG